jgi:hypothetical protein
MKITKEQQEHISAILKGTGLYYDIQPDYDPVTNTEEDCVSVYIDGDISFDTMAEIVDYLRGREK